MRVSGAQQRRLLAILLLHANQVVGRDRLVDLLWGEDPPTTATHGLEVQVSRLRKLLGPERLEASAGGYVLRVAPGELDVHRFRLLAAEGRRQLEQGDPAAALELLSEALATAGGRPLEEFENEPFARAEASALVELRLGSPRTGSPRSWRSAAVPSSSRSSRSWSRRRRLASGRAHS